MAASTKDKIDLSVEDMQFLLKLFETHSLTQTAASLDLSMGAASRRLAHVRLVFDDELFVRSGMSMFPTMRMRGLEPGMADLVNRTRRLLNPERFDLRETNRVVSLISADNGIATLLSSAVEDFYKAVPNSRLSILPLDRRVIERLREGSADMAFYPALALPPDFHSLPIYRSKLGILVREGHPLIDMYKEHGGTTHEMIRQWPAVGVNPGHRDGDDWGVENDQQVGVTVPYFLSVPYVLFRTNFVFRGPLITLRRFMSDTQFKLRILPVPEEYPVFVPRLVWHHGTHTDPFLQWVRGLVIDAARREAKALGVIETQLPA